jgi:potassium-transporting ATPase KdpC subunit
MRRAPASAHGLLPDDVGTRFGEKWSPRRIRRSRIAKSRGMEERPVGVLMAHHTEPRQWGFLGESRVNELELNLDLV